MRKLWRGGGVGGYLGRLWGSKGARGGRRCRGRIWLGDWGLLCLLVANYRCLVLASITSI